MSKKGVGSKCALCLHRVITKKPQDRRPQVLVGPRTTDPKYCCNHIFLIAMPARLAARMTRLYALIESNSLFLRARVS